MRTSNKKINPKLKKEIISTFFQTISDLKNKKEVEIFFKDFLNDSELETFAKRLAISYYLKKGRSYKNIKTNLKVSSATASSIARDIKKEGFKLALKKMEAEEWANEWSKKIQKLVK